MLQIRHSEERGQTDWGWLDSRHTFSFGDYHDPNRMGFRAFRVINSINNWLTRRIGVILLIGGLFTPLGSSLMAGTMAFATAELIERGEPLVNPAGHRLGSQFFLSGRQRCHLVVQAGPIYVR